MRIRVLWATLFAAFLATTSGCHFAGVTARVDEGDPQYYDNTCDSFYENCSSGSSYDDDYDSGDGYDDGGGYDDGDDYDNGGDDNWGGIDDGTFCDGSGFCYSAGNPGAGRDAAGHLADQENQKIKAAGDRFATKFKLKPETALNVAKAFYDWSQVSKRRTRTEKDIQAFTKRLYGVDFSRVTQAIGEASQGNMQPLDEAIGDAADHWGTTPETMKEILNDWYGGYVQGGK